MPENVIGIHHIALKCQGVAELDKTLHFYKEVLGLQEERRWGAGEQTGVMLSTGGGLLEIFADATDRPQAGAVRHVALAVRDTEQAVAAVRAAGYTVTTPPTDICIPSEIPYPAKIAFCIGPVGEELEFFEEK